MPQQKIVGQPCTYCGTPYIEGKKGAYCKPCYIEWKNRFSSTSPVPQNQTYEIQGDYVGKQQFNATFTKLNDNQQKIVAKIEELENRVKELEKNNIPIVDGEEVPF